METTTGMVELGVGFGVSLMTVMAWNLCAGCRELGASVPGTGSPISLRLLRHSLKSVLNSLRLKSRLKFFPPHSASWKSPAPSSYLQFELVVCMESATGMVEFGVGFSVSLMILMAWNPRHCGPRTPQSEACPELSAVLRSFRG